MFDEKKVFIQRREQLVERAQAPILLIADFENSRTRFVQDSTFYYFTGLNEPAVFCLIETSGKTTLFVPRYTARRADWVVETIDVETVDPTSLGVDAVVYAGEAVPGFIAPQRFPQVMVSDVLAVLKKACDDNGVVFVDQSRLIYDHLCCLMPDLASVAQDVGSYSCALRRVKTRDEVAKIYDAIGVTTVAHEAAARMLAPGRKECEVQAAMEYVYTELGAAPAFPSIVASGKNATILHYDCNSSLIEEGSCIVIDSGARLNHYCADITRTYPASGKFSDRQKEIYTRVLDTQSYIADLAKPGYWIKNEKEPERSLHHLALVFLKQWDLDRYFIHGIGHFLGLDVHDCGDYTVPLQAGDVITIEPGLYLPDENLGIRIEDNYWIVSDRAVCLSEELPKDIPTVEKMAQEAFSE